MGPTALGKMFNYGKLTLRNSGEKESGKKRRKNGNSHSSSSLLQKPLIDQYQRLAFKNAKQFAR